jgi:fructokinase
MVVVCGEAVIDLVPDGPGGEQWARPGGSPANVAVALARLGTPAQLLARLSTDHFGQILREHLGAAGVDLSLAVSTPQATAVAAVDLDPTGAPRYAFQLDGRTDDGWSRADLPPHLPEDAALHVSGAFALVRPAMRDTVAALLAREAGQRVVSFDPNPRPLLSADPEPVRSTLEKWVSLCDLVRASTEDLAWAYPDTPYETVARRWRERGPAVVVVTRGRDGVHALGPAGACDLPAEPVHVVDTVGAGDAFTAGLLTALDGSGQLTPSSLRDLDRDALVAALRFALRVAALTCARPGADPPRRAELESTVDKG